jgi:Tfp pilus assembly ATPase PilU
MYSIDDLLALVRSEQAEELRLRVGYPPVMVLRGEDHPVEGPSLTAETADQLLRGIANTRQMRELRDSGSIDFIYTFRNASPFLVHAAIEDEIISLRLR